MKNSHEYRCVIISTTGTVSTLSILAASAHEALFCVPINDTQGIETVNITLTRENARTVSDSFCSRVISANSNTQALYVLGQLTKVASALPQPANEDGLKLAETLRDARQILNK